MGWAKGCWIPQESEDSREMTVLHCSRGPTTYIWERVSISSHYYLSIPILCVVPSPSLLDWQLGCSSAIRCTGKAGSATWTRHTPPAGCGTHLIRVQYVNTSCSILQAFSKGDCLHQARNSAERQIIERTSLHRPGFPRSWEPDF